MALGNKKKTELKYHVDVEEFIPYAAHYDEETIITKNGELLQVIKIEGFAFETVKEENEKIAGLRGLIRETLRKNIKTDNFAIWFHTIRRESDLSTEGLYKQSFSNALNEKWQEKNRWRSQFVNELYISIVIEGEYFSIRNLKSFVNDIFIKTELRERKETLQQAAKKLSAVTNSVMSSLGGFGARKLSLFKRDGIYYSEIMGFASKLMNLRPEDVPVATADLSTVLPTHKVSFQYNTVMVEGATGKHFGAIFSVKEYREVTPIELDKLIQLPVNFIISQSFDFVPRELAITEFEEQKKIYDTSGSKRMLDLSGIKEIFEAPGGTTDFGQHQIVITVLEDSVKGLQKAVSDVVEALREMGVVFVREDLFMENCYWSMMPANFDFIKRKSYLPFGKAGGFASLHNFTTGKLRDNFWGNAVTAIPTRTDMPYFFNFHVDKSGHTIIFGEDRKARAALANFLISQAQKFDVRTIFIETDKASEVFVRTLGGKYLNEADFQGALENKDIKALGTSLNTGDASKFISLLTNIENTLSPDSPTIIFIGEQFSTIGDAQFISVMEGFTERFVEKNALLIFATSNNGLSGNGIFSPKMLENIKTKIFLPYPKANFDFKEAYALRESEYRQIKKLEVDAGEFLIKRGSDAVVVKFNFKGNKQLSLLTSDVSEIQLIDKAIAEAGSEEPEKWLSNYYKLAVK